MLLLERLSLQIRKAGAKLEWGAEDRKSRMQKEKQQKGLYLLPFPSTFYMY